MSTIVDHKLKDHVRWCMAGCRMLAEGHGAEALTDMRKAGEAAAKLIVLHGWPGKRGEEAIPGATLEDLVRTILRNGLAEGRTVGLLRTLQAEGNLAAHDHVHREGNAQLAFHALVELTNWVHRDLLGRQVPTELLQAMAAVEHTGTPDRREQELLDLQARIAEQDRRLAQLEGTRAAASHAAPAPAPDLADHTAAIAAVQAELVRTREELRAMAARANAPRPEEPSAAAPGRRPWPWVAGASVVALMIAAFILLQRGGAGPIERPARTPSTAANQADTVLRVLFIPFAIVQDDPNVRYDLAAALDERLQARSRATGIPVRLVVDTLQRNAVPPADTAWQSALAHSADAVVFGRLIEPTGNDSGSIDVHFAYARGGSVRTVHLAPYRFRTLMDSGALRALDACIWAADVAMGARLIRSGQCSRALALFHSARTPNEEEATVRHVYLAQAHASAGDLDAALEEAHACMARIPDDPQLHGFIGEVLTVSGDVAGARKAFERALELDPRDPEWKLGLANALFDARDTEGAATARSTALVDDVLRAHPEHGRAHFFRAMRFLREERWAEAADGCARALNTNDLNVQERRQALLNLCDLYAFRMGRAKDAVDLLNRFLLLAPNDARAHKLMAEIRTRSDAPDPVAARAHYARAQELTPAVDLDVLRGQAHTARLNGDLPAAIKLYAQAWAMDSTDARTANELGTALGLAHRYAEAVRMWRLGLRIDPWNHALNANLGELLLLGPAEVMDPEQGERHLLTAVATAPDDTTSWLLLGNARLERREVEGAEQAFRNVLRIAPDQPGAHRGMGLLRDAQQRYTEARMHYERALAADPDDDLVLSNLAYLCSVIEPPRLEQGLALARRSVKVNRSPENLVVLARLLALQQQVAEARDVYEEAVHDRQDLRMPDLEAVFAAKGYR